MLSAADADLVRRDAALPGLAVVLDPEAVAARLRAALPGLRSAHATYVRYKPATSCLVAYRLESADGQLLAYAKAFGGRGGEKLAKMAGARGAVPPACIWDAERVALAVFPNDRRLRALRRLAREDERRRLLRRALLGHPALWNGDTTVIAYKPERRCVVRLDADGEPRALLKAYSDADYERARVAWRSLAADALVRTPRFLGESRRHRLVALEWLPGRQLRPAEPGDAWRLHAAGRALAALHGLRGLPLLALDREREARRLLLAARSLVAVLPAVAPRARRLGAELAERVRALPPVHVPIHGDFSADQVLVTDAEIAIVDLDGAALGDPAADLGRFEAALHAEALAGDLPDRRLGDARDALLSGYGANGSLRRRMDLYVAASLLQAAVEPFRHRVPDWPVRAARMLGRAEEIAAT